MDAVTAALFASVHNPWHARIYLAANTGNLTANTWTRVAYDTVDYDPSSMASGLGTSSAELTIPVNGLYIVSMNAGYGTSPGDGVRNIAEIIRTSAAGTPTQDLGAYRIVDVATGAAGAFSVFAGTTLWYMQAGQIITGWAFVGAAVPLAGGYDNASGGLLYNSLAVAFIAPI